MRQAQDLHLPRTIRWQSCYLRPLLEEVCQAFSPEIAGRGVDLRLDVEPDVTVLADRALLRRAAVQLVGNALSAMPAGGELCVTAVVGPRGVEVEIADSGRGLPGAGPAPAGYPEIDAMHEVEQIVRLHGGKVAASNCPEGGAAYTLFLPRRHLVAAA